MRAVLVALVVLAMWASPATAQGETKTLTIDGGELATCAPGETFCFAVAEGDLEGFAGGMEVTITFRSLGVLPHNLLVTTAANADENRTDTQADVAIAESATVNPGESDEITFVVPAEATGLYFWCDVGDHEEQGMWLEASATPSMTTTTGGGNDTMMGGNDTMEDESNGTPLGVVAPVVALVAAAFAARRKP